jgi:hypothetical protein
VKSRRGLLALLVIFMVLVVAVVWQQNREINPVNPDSDGAAAALTGVGSGRESFLFPEVAVLDIVTINLRNPNDDTTLTFTRSDDGTWFAADNRGVLNADAASAVARTIVLTSFEREIPLTAETPLGQYGFLPYGTLFVEFITVDGEEHIIAVGGLTNDRAYIYVIVDDRSTLYLVPRGPIDFLIQMLENVR